MLVRGITPVGDADQFPCLYVEETEISLGPSQVARQNHLRLRSLLSSVKSTNMDQPRAPTAGASGGRRKPPNRPPSSGRRFRLDNSGKVAARHSSMLPGLGPPESRQPRLRR